MHLILTGATGLVGTAILHHILSLPPTTAIAQKISTLTILSRRPTIPLLEHPSRPQTNTHTQIRVLPHTDFKTYPPSTLSTLQIPSSDADPRIGVLWALGISQSLTPSEAEYDEITRVYPLEAARAFSTGLNAQHVNFVYVSGEGATHAPGYFTPLFGRVKGRAERELTELMREPPCADVLRVLCVRPGAVDAGAEESQRVVWELTHAGDGGSGGKTRAGMGVRVMEKSLFPVIRAGVFKGMHSPTGEMSRVMVELAVGAGEPVEGKGVELGGRVVSNAALRRLGEGVKGQK